MSPKSKSKSKALAKVAKPPAAAPQQRSQTQRLAGVVGFVGLILVLAAVSSPLSQLVISPVYGSIPSYQHHQQALVFTTLAAFIARPSIEHRVPANLKDYVPVLAFWIPVIQFFLFKISFQLGPGYGPLITEYLTYFPLLFLASLTSARLLADLKIATESRLMGELIPAVGPYMFFSFMEKATTVALSRIVGTSLLFTRTSLQLIVATLFSILIPSKLLAFALPALLHTVWVNPHFQSTHTTALLNTTLQSYNWTLIDRKESLTGYISVLESRESQFRLLRCDHSLLGGEWLLTPERIAQGQQVAEPVYQVFTMLEAVRLIETPSKRAEKKKSALVM